MKADLSFSNILSAASKGWRANNGDEGLLSLALPIERVDPLEKLPLLAKEQTFRFLWDQKPSLTFAAAGQCQNLDLEGPKRFELAQRFCDLTLGRLKDANPEAPVYGLPKVLLAFSFFEKTAERQRDPLLPPGVQAVLPRWQLSTQGKESWLRINGNAVSEADARELAEKLWLMAEQLTQPFEPKFIYNKDISFESYGIQNWEKNYVPVLNKGLELINNGSLKKLVLAVRCSIKLNNSLDPLNFLWKLRRYQSESCRFLWERSKQSCFFGASPEKLLSIHNNQLRSDALAGTSNCMNNGQDLFQSKKDRIEHELVVNSIIKQLAKYGIKGQHPRLPKLRRFGQLFHLHTPITANTEGHLPLHIANALHPTPAVAGLPCKEAISWLRALEPFERGGYAAPIGWIDKSGNTELRVAIRSGKTRNKVLELTAGAGLVKGSIAEKEIQEVGLKLAVLASQLNQAKSFNKRSIT